MKIDSDAWRQAVMDGAAALDVAVSDAQACLLGVHARELLAWNRVTNLTAITDPLEVAIKHYVDSLAALTWIAPGTRVLDAGAGGGFPGIPLAIMRPDLTVVLVDSVRKKVSFLKHAIRTLGLTGVSAVHGRLEQLAGDPAHAGQYDTVVCRAFSSLEDFGRLTEPFLENGGQLLALKGPQADHDHEARALQTGRVEYGGRRFDVQTHGYRLPRLDSQRRLVRVTMSA